ncbi:MAG TPA: lysophospholipid acyltransferase family protein, partial [Polyangiaceae bacterium]|nr:lysophospholipid acyltransferase family protein [Polyangiaceae bacterium]
QPLPEIASARGEPRGSAGETAPEGRLRRLHASDSLHLLTALERAQIRLIRASLRPGALDRTIRTLQGGVGQWWIRAATASLRHVHGLERLPAWNRSGSVVCVANHRSLFDLYVTAAELVARGLPHRILFPVRSEFFYDHPLGPLVNGVMSFFAMYPPIFRDKKRAALNLAGLDELAALLRRGGFFVGIHPEGTRKKDDDPYTLLPAQSGVGRVIRKAGVPVVPVFVNGLGNDLVKQVAGGIAGTGTPIHIVFGAPIAFGSLMDLPENPRTYRLIAERCLERIAELGQEEKAIRAQAT